MTYKPSRRFRFYAIALVCLFVYVMVRGAWIHFFPSEPPLPPSALPKTSHSTTPDEETGTGLKAITEQISTKDSQQYARRIVHVPGPSTDIGFDRSQINQVTSDSVVKFTTSALEKALGGEIDAAVGLRRLRWLCEETYNTKSMSQLRLNHMMEWAERLGPGLSTEGQAQTLTGGEGMIVMIYPTERQNRDYLSQWHEQCERARLLFNHDLRRRLEKLAQNGHVMARYLYASWKPSMTIDSGVFERTTRWHLNATDFSYANLEEGELAGMIAIGESYIYGGFTPHNLRLGLFTLRAALECGLESSEIEHFVSRYLEDGSIVRLLSNESAEEVGALMVHLTSYCQ